MAINRIAIETETERLAGEGMEPTSPIEAAIEIDASPSRVWEAISGVGNLTDVHPFCATNEVERWPGADGRDHVRYFGGVHYQRDVLEWREGSGYDLSVGPPSTGKIAVARWWIEPMADDRSRFGIEVTSFVRASSDPASKADYVATVINGAIPP